MRKTLTTSLCTLLCVFFSINSLTAQITLLTCPENQTVELTNQNGTSISWALPTATTTCPSGNITITQLNGPQSPTFIQAPGGESIVYRLTDDCGESVICDFVIGATIVPLEFSTTCPSNISVITNDQNTGVVVDYNTPAIVTNCSLGGGVQEVELINGLASGSVFPVGATPVVHELSLTCNAPTVTDDCIFIVEVSYVPPPSITCTNLTSPVDGAIEVDVNSIINWAPVDNATNYLLSIGTMPGTNEFFNESNVGNVTTFDFTPLEYNTTYYITVTPINVDEPAQNCIEESFTSASEPTETIITCPPSQTVELTPGEISTNISWLDATATTSCTLGGLVVEQLEGPPSGSSFQTASSSTIQYGATDDCGNVDLCSFSVEVTTVPLEFEITCPFTMTVLTDNPDGIVVNYDTPAIFTNCNANNGTVTQTSGLPSGAVFPLGESTQLFDLELNCFGTMAADDCLFFINVIFSEVPTCPQLTSPENGATGVDINADLTWSASDGPTSGYNLSMGTTPGGTELFDNEEIPGNITTFDPGELENNTTYYVSITPFNNNGEAIDCIAESFTTEIASIITVTSCQENETYEVVEGTSNSIFVNWQTPIASTTCPGGIITIQQVSGPQGGGTSINVPGGTSVTYLIMDECGGVETCSFSIGTVYVPLEFEVICGSDITIETSDPNGAIVNYNQPEVNTNCSGNVSYSSSAIPSGSLFPLGETPVYIETTLNCFGIEYTEDCLFFVDVKLVPTCTNLSSPLDGAINVPTDSPLSWNEVPGVSGYYLTVGTTSGGADVVDDQSVFATTYDLGVLENGTEYYVTIVPFYQGNRATGCIEESFTTLQETEITFSCSGILEVEPLAGQDTVTVFWPEPTATTTCSTGTVTIDQVNGIANGSLWNVNLIEQDIIYSFTDECGNSEICSFLVRIDDNPVQFDDSGCSADLTVETTDPNGVIVNFDEPFVQSNCTQGTETVIQNAGIAPGMLFPVGTTLVGYDVNLECNGDPYNEFCNFNVTINLVIDAIDCTSLSNPTNGATNVPNNSTLNWNAVAEATGYLLSIGTMPGTNDFMNGLNVGNVTTYDLGPLGYSATYYVTVVPYDEVGNATDCLEESFTTEAEVSILTVTLCPEDITRTIPFGENTVNITWPEPTATTTCSSGDVTIFQVNGPPNGINWIPIQVDGITYVFQDECGNEETCTFVVRADPEQLVFDISCPNDMVVNANSDAGATAIFDEPGVNNNCTDGTINLIQVAGLSSGSLFPIGVTNVVYEVNLDCLGDPYTLTCNFNVTVNAPSDCPPAIPGFSVLGEFDNHKYFISDNSESWMSASATAAANSAYLVSINDAAENEFLRSNIGNNIVFIGLNDAATEGQYQWDSGEAFTFDFIETPPIDGAEDFANMNFWSGGWSFDNQFVQRRYIIETTCGPVPTSLSVNCPTDIAVTIPLGQSTTIVNYDLPTYNTTCSATETVEVNLITGLASGSVFNVGTTDIEYEIVLTCGDEVLTQFCQFAVTVEQTDITCSETIDGFTFMGSYNEHNYFLSNDMQSWPNAAAIAATNNGYLVSMNDAEENEFVRSQIGNNIVFIGLSDAQAEGDYQWNSGEAFNYNFIESFPTNPDKDYANMNFWSGGWAFDVSFVQRLFVLEVECGVQAPTMTVDCPMDQVFIANAGQTSATVNWSGPMAFSTCPDANIDYTQIGGPANGSTLMVDSPETISYEITDECGNVEVCTFTVILESFSTTMTINCPQDQVYVANPGVTSQAVIWTDVTATTNCPSQTITYSQQAGPFNGDVLLADQPEFIEFLISDDCGNTETCSFTVLLESQSSGGCPDELEGFELLGEFEGHKYFKALQPKRWMEAQQIAADNGGYLASITSAAENDFLKNNVSVITMIGLNDVESEGNLVWDSGEPIGFDFVETANDGEGDFGAINFWNGGWLFVNQWVQKPYIIEFSCEPSGPELTVNCIGDIVMTADPGVNAMAINWELPFASTTCPQGMVTANQLTGSPSGASYMVGDSELITYEFTDECGNTETCNFNVVLNAFALTLDLDCPQDISMSVEEGVTEAIVNFDEPTVFTNCPNISNTTITQIAGEVSGGIFPIGTTTVMYDVELDCGGEILIEQCSFTITVAENSGVCPDQLDNFEFLGAYEGHHYFLAQNPLTWANAQTNAADLGAYLVSITTFDENEFLRENISNIVMTGLNDQNVEGQFEWDSGEAFDYANITDGNMADADFGTINFWNGGWGTVNQWVQKPYIIEFSCGVTNAARMSFGHEIDIHNIFPNPTAENITIDIRSAFEKVSTIQIFDIIGQLKMEIPIDLRSGMTRQTLDISSLDEGIHFVRIRGNEERAKFVKINSDNYFLNN